MENYTKLNEAKTSSRTSTKHKKLADIKDVDCVIS
jgi:hypothetical protein